MTQPVRASADWLSLRERADAAARSPLLLDAVRAHVTGRRAASEHEVARIHDLGCGTGSMARWLAGRLPGPQHWVMVDRDAELLALADENRPQAASDGARVTVETRRRDITRLPPQQLEGAWLVTASAVLDMMTADELDGLVAACAAAGCPVLVALTVTGGVDLTPADPLDERVRETFNAHQRRDRGGRRLLGPDAARAASVALSGRGLEVLARPSPWRLGPDERALAAAWFTGWLGAACEQDPALSEKAGPYAARRLAQAAAGQLWVTVHHEDLLARPS